MIAQKAYPAEPWQVRETALDLGVLAQSESVFALSNGHIGLRANLDEGEPHALPGTYLNSVYEERPLPYAEAGYGYPPSGQTVISWPRRGSSERMNSWSDFSSSTNRTRSDWCGGVAKRLLLFCRAGA